MTPKWPERARAAIRRLFEPLQDVDVYVEDVGDEAFYRRLLQRAVDGKVRVARVFGLGGREVVLARAAGHDFVARRALYLIDGDSEYVRGDPPPATRGVYRLEAYCIENLVMCEEAISTVLAEELGIEPAAALAALDFGAWKARLQAALVELSAACAVVVTVDPPIRCTGRGVGELCEKQGSPPTHELSLAKVSALVADVLADAGGRVGGTDVDERHKAVVLRVQSLTDPLAAVSGKTYLLPLLRFRMGALGASAIKSGPLRMRLAAHVVRRRLTEVSTALQRAAGQRS